MADENDGKSGEGAGDGGATPENPNEPGGAEGSTGESTPSDVNLISADILPEALRGRSEGELKFLLDSMVTTTVNQRDEIAGLKHKLGEIDARTKEPPTPPEPDPYEGESTEDLMLKDPTAAVKRVLGELGIFDQLSGASSRLGTVEMDRVAGEFPDFEEHRESVETLVTEMNLPKTSENIRGAYLLSLGNKTHLDRVKATQAVNPASIDPSPPGGGEGSKNDVTLTELQKEFARGLNMTDEAYASAMVNEAEIPVPIGGGKHG